MRIPRVKINPIKNKKGTSYQINYNANGEKETMFSSTRQQQLKRTTKDLSYSGKT